MKTKFLKLATFLMLVAALMLGCIMQASAVAESVDTVMYDGFEYEITDYENNYVTFVKGYDSTVENVVIPEKFTVDGYDYTVTAAKPNFFNTKIRTFQCPDVPVTFADYAFAYCTALESFTVLGDVTSYSTGIFAGCSSMKEFEISSTVDSLPDDMFINAGLETITIPSNVKTIGSSFLYCRNLTKVVIESGVENIGVSAFQWCNNLREVTIQSGVESIGASAFAYCDSLESISIPSSVKTIGYNGLRAPNMSVKIYYGGTADEWAAISSESGLNDVTPIFCNNEHKMTTVLTHTDATCQDYSVTTSICQCGEIITEVGTEYAECVDADNDGKCDVCGANLGTDTTTDPDTDTDTDADEGFAPLNFVSKFFEFFKTLLDKIIAFFSGVDSIF